MQIHVFMLRLFVILFVFIATGCSKPQEMQTKKTDEELHGIKDSLTTIPYSTAEKEALISTRFKSLEDLKKVVEIKYAEDLYLSASSTDLLPQVQLIYRYDNREIISELKKGIGQTDFVNARKGSLIDKVLLGLRCPFAIVNKSNLASIENLGRRRPWVYGKGDVAFYDLAETMVAHIRAEDLDTIAPDDLTEKGYLNTFNHITAQAFMTSVFSEAMADFVADVHELFNMPELITGKFSEKQLTDPAEGPVDNYVDMINNESGQELGKVLKAKYAINSETEWNPVLLADYLNDIQSYQSWVFQIGFQPFREEDDVVQKFANKINKVLSD